MCCADTVVEMTYTYLPNSECVSDCRREVVMMGGKQFLKTTLGSDALKIHYRQMTEQEK